MNSLFVGLLLGTQQTRTWPLVVLSDEERAHAARMFSHLQPIEDSPAYVARPRPIGEMLEALAQHAPPTPSAREQLEGAAMLAALEAMKAHPDQFSPTDRLETERAAMLRGLVPFDAERLRAVDLDLARVRAIGDALYTGLGVMALGQPEREARETDAEFRERRAASHQAPPPYCPCCDCIREGYTPATVEATPADFKCLREQR